MYVICCARKNFYSFYASFSCKDLYLEMERIATIDGQGFKLLNKKNVKNRQLDVMEFRRIAYRQIMLNGQMTKLSILRTIF